MQPIIIIILLIIVCCCCVCVSLSGGLYMTRPEPWTYYDKYVYSRDYGTVGDISVITGIDRQKCGNKCNDTIGCNAYAFSVDNNNGVISNTKCVLKELTKDSKYIGNGKDEVHSKDDLGKDYKM